MKAVNFQRLLHLDIYLHLGAGAGHRGKRIKRHLIDFVLARSNLPQERDHAGF
jgi:hypothetical protein